MTRAETRGNRREKDDSFADFAESLKTYSPCDCAYVHVCVFPHYLSRHLYFNSIIQTLVGLHYFNSALISPITVSTY